MALNLDRDLAAHLKTLLPIYESIRKHCPVALYRPNNKLREFHESTASLRAIEGGNQAGKTHALMAEVIACALGFRPWLPPDHPYFLVRLARGNPIPIPSETRVTCVDYTTALNMTLMPKFLELAPPGAFDVKKNQAGHPTLVSWRWGSRTVWVSHDQDPRVGESGTFQVLAHDEPPPRPLRIALCRGLMRWGGIELFAYTPVYEDWMEEEITKRADGKKVLLLEVDSRDNLIENGGVMTKEGYEDFERKLTPVERKIRLRGKRAGDLARVVPDFQDTYPWVVDPFEIPLHWPRILVADPHERKPDCLVWVAFNPKRPEAYVYDSVMDPTTAGTIYQTCQTIRDRESRTGGARTRAIIDPRFGEKRSRSTGLTILEEFSEEGIYFDKAPGIALDEGFRRLNEWFRLVPQTGEPYLRVFSNLRDPHPFDHIGTWRNGVIDSLLGTRWPMKDGQFQQKQGLTGPDDQSSCLRYLRVWNPRVDMLSDEVVDTLDIADPLLMDEAMVQDGTHTGY